MSLFDANAAAVVDSIAAIFADDAVYVPAGGGPSVDIQIVLGWVDDPAVTFGGLQTPVRSPGLRGQVAQAQLPDIPEKGATIQVVTGKHAGKTLTVSDSFGDLEQSQWTLDLS